MSTAFPVLLDVPESLCILAAPLPLPTPKAALYKRLLADLGGISSITKIQEHAQPYRSDLPRRNIVSSFKHQNDIKSLGAGYYSFVEMNVLPVQQWLHQWLKIEGVTPLAHCIEAILRHYPNGDAKSISRWFAQGVPTIRNTWNGCEPTPRVPIQSQRGQST